jgi:aminoglycoside phosphotransferase (APT) family kinase protein
VDDRRVGGFGAVAELVDAYADAGGTAPDADRLRYWEVFGTLKWGVICKLQAAAHRSGLVRSVELAILGRRVAETEWDLLELIG